MNKEFAKILHLLEEKGVSKSTGSEWRRKTLVLQGYRQTDRGELVSKGDDNFIVEINGKQPFYDSPKLAEGEIGMFGYFRNTTEYNGKYYGHNNCLEFIPMTAQAVAATQQTSKPAETEAAPAATQTQNSTLPF